MLQSDLKKKKQQPFQKIPWWTCGQHETLEKRKPLKNCWKWNLYQRVTGVFMAHHVYKWLSVYADKMLWQIVTRILACQTSCDSCWFIMRMLSPQTMRTPEVFCQASVASWTLDQNFKDFQRPFESQFPPQEQEEKKISHWNKKRSSCQPANQHTQLWSYLALTPQPPLIGPLLPRYSAHCCAVGP